MFKLSSDAPAQARNQKTIAESAHEYKALLQGLPAQAGGAAPILSRERAAELIADAERAKRERDLARSQALMQVRIDDAQRVRQVGDALLSWTEHKDADKVQQEATPATAAAADQTPTENMRVWRASAYPLERTLAGILEIARTSEGRARVACFLPSYTGEGSVSDSALLGADGRLPFTIPMLLAAVEAELPHQAIPVKDVETRRAWVRTLYPQIQFYTRRLDDLERKQDLLNEAYAAGLSLGEDAVNQRVAILRVA